MTPAMFDACAEYVAAVAKAKALEAEAKTIEAGGLARLGEAMRTLASNATVADAGSRRMTPAQFANAHGMSRALVYRLMDEGALPFEQLTPRKREINEELALVALQAARTSASKPKAAHVHKCVPEERVVKRTALRVIAGRSQASR